MATREASVKLTLNASGFIQETARIKTEAGKVGEAFKKSLREVNVAGLRGFGNGLKGAFSDIGSTLKSQLAPLAAIGGGVGLGAMVGKALDVREQFKLIEFQINKTGRATVEWKKLLEDARETAIKHGQSSEDMGRAIAGVFSATGDADFAIAATEQIAAAAHVAGGSVEQWADASALLKEKFGATAKTLPAMLAVLIEKTRAGALSLDDLGTKFGKLSGEAAGAGLDGGKGFAMLLDVMDAVDDKAGESAQGGMKKILQTMKDGSSTLKALQKQSGIKLGVDTTAFEKIRKLMGSDKGLATLQATFKGDARTVFDELIRPFTEAQAEAKKHSATTKEATQAGLAAFDAAMAKLGQTALSTDAVHKKSLEKTKDDPRAKLNEAMEKMAATFQKPEMMRAVDKLAEKLPALAEAVASLVEYVVDNPWKAAGLAVGGKMAMGGIGGALSGVLGKIGDKLDVGGKIEGAFSRTMERIMLGKKSSLPGDMGSGIAAHFMQQQAAGAASAGGMAGRAGKALGAVAGVGMAAMAGWEVGTIIAEKFIAPELDAHFAKRGEVQDVAATAEAMASHGTGSREERAQAAAQLRDKITKMQNEGGPGLLTETIGGWASIFSDVKHPLQDWADTLNNAKAQLARLEEVDKARQASDKLATSLKQTTQVVDQLGAALGRAVPPGTPTGTSKGPGGVGNKAPGHVPTHG